jgi:uncharacterized membrane protein
MIVPLLRAYLVVALSGLAVAPCLRALCPGLPDRGHAAARCLGPFLAAWLAFLLAGAAGVPLGPGIALSAVALLAALSWGAARLMRPARAFGAGSPGPPSVGPETQERTRLPAWAWIEGITLCGAFLFQWILSHNPAVDPDSERFMDYAFLQATLRAPGLPVADPWFAGEPLNYYGFVYVVAAFVTRAAGLASGDCFLPVIALLHALTWAGAFGLGLAITGRARGGLTAALLVLGAGNFEWVRQLLRGGWMGGLDWFASARVIAGTINEFPWFSLLWGDLHPYVAAPPLVLGALSIAVAAALPGGQAAGGGRRAGAGRLALFALACGALLATHPWDLPLVAVLAAGLLLLRPGGGGRALLYAAAALAGSLAFLPFVGGFSQSGRRLAWAADRSHPAEWAMAFGPFVLLALLAAMTPARARAGVANPGDATRRERARAGLAVAAAGVLAALIGEVVYVEDIFAPTTMARMNTVFKLHRCAWVLMGIASAVPCESLLRRGRRGLAALALVAAGAAVYPLAGTAAWIRHRDAVAAAGAAATAPPSAAPGAGAEGLFRRLRPGDAAAVDHLSAAARPGEALLEETGEAYTWSSRVATFSGVPTVLGWGNHEAGWRNAWGPVLERRREIAAIYADPESDRGRALLRRHRVAWVVVGDLERRRYGEDVARRFEALGRRVVDAGGTQLFRLTPGREP